MYVPYIPLSERYGSAAARLRRPLEPVVGRHLYFARSNGVTK
jgi:hypothetical protein